MSCPTNICALAAPHRAAGKARVQVNTGRIDLWPQRGMRPDAGQPEGFGPYGALDRRPEWVQTPSLDPPWPPADHHRLDSNESTDICGTGHYRLSQLGTLKRTMLM